MENSTLTPYGFVQNDSFYDYDEVLCKNGFEAEYRHVAIPIILSIAIIFSFIGNILVVVIGVFMRLASLSSIFILNLALSDLLFTVGLVFWVCEYVWASPFGDAVCYIALVLLSTGFYSSIMFLMVLSTQRYIAIVSPSSGWKKGRCSTFVFIIIWLVSILSSLPATVHSRLISDSENLVLYCITYCHTDVINVAVTYRESIIFVCAFLVMGFCYIRILQTILKCPTNHRRRTTGLAFLLAAAYFMFWAPYVIANFLYNLIYRESRFVPQCEVSRLNFARYICQLLAFTRCCINPLIYGLTGQNFLKLGKSLIKGGLISNIHK